MKSIVLVGMSGVGKTTIARELSLVLNKEYIDLDRYIEETLGKSINDIFLLEGEEYFRQMEEEALKIFIEKDDIIISTGGGVILKKENRSILKEREVIHLDGSVETIYRNIKKDKKNTRPILNTTNMYSKLQDIYRYRKKLYTDVAKYIVNTDNKGIHDIVDEIVFIIKNLSCS